MSVWVYGVRARVLRNFECCMQNERIQAYSCASLGRCGRSLFPSMQRTVAQIKEESEKNT